jgi:hypothetical protein
MHSVVKMSSGNSGLTSNPYERDQTTSRISVLKETSLIEKGDTLSYESKL